MQNTEAQKNSAVENTMAKELLYRMATKAISNNRNFQKDLEKSKHATKFIGRGSLASSTNRYMIAAGDLANTGKYNERDIVFVSVEGARRGRISFNKDEIDLAIHAMVTFVTDGKDDRERDYNMGERELAAYLQSKNYVETSVPGIWKHTQ